MTARMRQSDEPARAAESTRAVGDRLSVGAGAIVWAASFVAFFWSSWRAAWSADETATVMVARRPVLGVLRTFRFDPALEPYYLFMKLWSSPSTSHAWMRLPSVLAMAGAVTALAVLTTRLLGRRAGIAAAVIMLVLPATSRFAQEARPYSFAVLFVVLAVACWADDRLGTSRRRQAGLALFLLLAGMAQSFALAVVPALLLASWWTPRADRRRELSATATASAVAIALASPFLVVLGEHATGQPGPPPVTIVNIMVTAGRLPVQILSPPLAVAFAAAALVLTAAGILLAVRDSGRRRRAAVLAVAWLCLPPLELCLLQLTTGAPGLVARYWLFSLPALAIAGAIALDRLWSHSRIVGALAVVLIGGLAVPTQVSAREVDGHLGQGWLDLPRVLELAAVRRAPLLTRGWNYHALVGNNPATATRMPLTRDPGPSGRILPQVDGPGSAAFRSLVRTTNVVVVLATERSASTALPKRNSFAGFRRELRAFPTAAVECEYFGQSLGVFTTSSSAPSMDAHGLANQIEAIAPGNVRCAVPRGG